MRRQPIPTVEVRAAAGMVVPKEGRRRAFFSHDRPETVRLTSYVKRRLKDGGLERVEDKPKAKPSPKPTKKGE